jgi:hypothetical protein
MNGDPYLVKVTVYDGGIPNPDASITFSWIVKQHDDFLPVIIH